jgi:hypothetical protein
MEGQLRLAKWLRPRCSESLCDVSGVFENGQMWMSIPRTARIPLIIGVEDVATMHGILIRGSLDSPSPKI